MTQRAEKSYFTDVSLQTVLYINFIKIYFESAYVAQIEFLFSFNHINGVSAVQVDKFSHCS